MRADEVAALGNDGVRQLALDGFVVRVFDDGETPSAKRDQAADALSTPKPDVFRAQLISLQAQMSRIERKLDTVLERDLQAKTSSQPGARAPEIITWEQRFPNFPRTIQTFDPPGGPIISVGKKTGSPSDD